MLAVMAASLPIVAALHPANPVTLGGLARRRASSPRVWAGVFWLQRLRYERFHAAWSRKVAAHASAPAAIPVGDFRYRSVGADHRRLGGGEPAGDGLVVERDGEDEFVAAGEDDLAMDGAAVLLPDQPGAVDPAPRRQPVDLDAARHHQGAVGEKGAQRALGRIVAGVEPYPVDDQGPGRVVARSRHRHLRNVAAGREREAGEDHGGAASAACTGKRVAQACHGFVSPCGGLQSDRAVRRLPPT